MDWATSDSRDLCVILYYNISCVSMYVCMLCVLRMCIWVCESLPLYVTMYVLYGQYNRTFRYGRYHLVCSINDTSCLLTVSSVLYAVDESLHGLNRLQYILVATD